MADFYKFKKEELEELLDVDTLEQQIYKGAWSDDANIILNYLGTGNNLFIDEIRNDLIAEIVRLQEDSEEIKDPLSFALCFIEEKLLEQKDKIEEIKLTLMRMEQDQEDYESSNDPKKLFFEAEDDRIFMECFNSLSKDEKIIWKMHYKERFRVWFIAKKLRVKPNRISNIKYRALKKMKKLLLGNIDPGELEVYNFYSISRRTL